MARRRSDKSANGEGKTPGFSIFFDLSDPDEARAFEMAQQLATPHGRRKDAIVAYLLALSEIQLQTGMEFNAAILSSTMIANSLLGVGQNIGGGSRMMQNDIVVENTQKVDPHETDRKLFESMGSLF